MLSFIDIVLSLKKRKFVVQTVFYVRAIETITTVFPMCTEMLPSPIELTSQARSALRPQAIFTGKD